MRRLPCIHRTCINSSTMALCTRQVCLYVHDDYKPNMYGAHNPEDPLWIVFPGMLPSLRWAGPVKRLPEKTEEEHIEAFSGIGDRQREGRQMMEAMVESGQATSLEFVTIDCQCVANEAGDKILSDSAPPGPSGV